MFFLVAASAATFSAATFSAVASTATFATIAAAARATTATTAVVVHLVEHGHDLILSGIVRFEDAPLETQ